jgi:hypothetical protein
MSGFVFLLNFLTIYIYIYTNKNSEPSCSECRLKSVTACSGIAITSMLFNVM